MVRYSYRINAYLKEEYMMHPKARVNRAGSANNSFSLRTRLGSGVKITALMFTVFLLQFNAAVAAVHGSPTIASQTSIVLRATKPFATSDGLNKKWIWINKDGEELVVVRRGKVIEPDPYLLDIQRGKAATSIVERYRILKSQNILACKSIRAELVTYKQWPFTQSPKLVSMFVVISGKQYVVTYQNLRDPGSLPQRIASFFRDFCGIRSSDA